MKDKTISETVSVGNVGLKAAMVGVDFNGDVFTDPVYILGVVTRHMSSEEEDNYVEHELLVLYPPLGCYPQTFDELRDECQCEIVVYTEGVVAELLSAQDRARKSAPTAPEPASPAPPSVD